MSQHSIINLLIFAKDSDKSEQAIGVARTLGYAVRPTCVMDIKTLVNTLKQGQFDIFLCCVQSIAPNTLAEVAHIIKSLKAELRLILWLEAGYPLDAQKLTECAAVDAVNKDKPDHLKLVIYREYQAIQALNEVYQAKKALQYSEDRSQLLMKSSKDAIAYLHQGLHIDANKSYLELFKFADLGTARSTSLVDLVDAKSRQKLKSFLKKSDRQQSQIELKLTSVDSVAFDAHLTLCNIQVDDESVQQVIVQKNDKNTTTTAGAVPNAPITEGRREHITQLLPRIAAVAAKGSVSYALMHIQFDRLDEISEEYGLTNTDKIITAIARLLENRLGPRDAMARLEGITYTLLLGNPKSRNISQFAQQIVAAIKKQLISIDPGLAELYFCIGIAMINKHACEPTKVLLNAKKALNEAQKSGQLFHIYQSNAAERTQANIDEQWSRRIARAIKNDLFSLLYQPIVNFTGDPTERYDMSYGLLEKTGHITPHTQFIDAAEHTGLAHSLNQYIVLAACKQLATSLKYSSHTVLCAPISAKIFTDPDFPAWLEKLFGSTKLPSKSLILHLSEHAIKERLNSAKAFASDLRKVGCKLMVSDVSTEKSSVNILHELAVDYIKINPVLMANINTDTDNQQKIKTLVKLARKQGITTVAPNIIDATSFSSAWGLGVDLVQGNFLQEKTNKPLYDFSAMSA